MKEELRNCFDLHPFALRREPLILKQKVETNKEEKTMSYLLVKQIFGLCTFWLHLV